MFAAENTEEFAEWCTALSQYMFQSIKDNLGEFKMKKDPIISSSVFAPSSNPQLYPPELRCRLATTGRGDEAYSVAALYDTSTGMEMDASEIMANGFFVPVFRVGYYKDGDTFGLQFTVLKGEYERPLVTATNHHAWVIDNGATVHM